MIQFTSTNSAIFRANNFIQSRTIDNRYKNDCFVKTSCGSVSFGKATPKIESFEEIIAKIVAKAKAPEHKEVSGDIFALVQTAKDIHLGNATPFDSNILNCKESCEQINCQFSEIYDEDNPLLNLKRFIISADIITSGRRGYLDKYKAFEPEITGLTCFLKKVHFDDKLDEDTRKMVDKIHKATGTKVFISNNPKMAKMLYRELFAVKKAAVITGEQINFPKNIDFSSQNSGAMSYLNSIFINPEFAEKNKARRVFRHELAHNVSTKEVTPTDTYLIDELSFSYILEPEEEKKLRNLFNCEELYYNQPKIGRLIVKSQKNTSPIIQSANKKLVAVKTQMDANLGHLPQYRKNVAQHNQKELIAVAYESLPKEGYSADFEGTLKKCGLPAAMLGCAY